MSKSVAGGSARALSIALRNISKFSICASLAFAGGILAAQPAPENAKQQFEVASVKPVKATGSERELAMARILDMIPRGSIPMPSPGRVQMEGRSLRQLIAAAYRVRVDQVSGPAWMQDLRFDIEAKMPEGATAGQANEMLQSLLAERFGLELHHESRESSGFVLIVGKRGPKLEESTPPVRALSREEMQERQKQWTEERMKAQQRTSGSPPMAGRSRSSFTGVSMAQFAERLMPMAGGPIVDGTGLSGKYNLTIETWRATDDDPGQNVFQAVTRLGLELSPRKAPVDILVIDKISKTPTGN